MNFFHLFKRTNKSNVSECIISQPENITSTEKIETKLSYHPSWQVTLDQQYMFNFHAYDLEPLKRNQLSIAPISLIKDEDSNDWHITVFIRSTLDQEILLGTLQLQLLENGFKIAEKAFDLSELGHIPSNSARPWIFTFEEDIRFTNNLPNSNWHLVFVPATIRKHQLHLDASWESQLNQEQKALLNNLFEQLPALQNNELNIIGYHLVQQGSSSIITSLFLRNGQNSPLEINELPLALYDANYRLITKKNFTFAKPLIINANSSKPYNFTFPTKSLQYSEIELTRWHVKIDF